MRKLLITAVVAALAAITFVPVVHADPGGQAGLSRPFSAAGGPFIGDWGAHKERVTVNADGSGVETAGRGTLYFTLGSVQTSANPWDTAYGNVTSGFLERGAFVTLQLQDGGNGMAFSTGGGDTMFPFCKVGAGGNYLNSYDCGA